MWYQTLPGEQSWTRLWSGYILCDCGGIRTIEACCPVCSQPISKGECLVLCGADGKEHRIPQAFRGAEGRYEDYIYLRMLEREWLRPASEDDHFPRIPLDSGPSPRAAVVLVFWTYFETRLERLLRATMKCLPAAVMEDLLSRYSSIGARLDRLYRILFSATYWADLEELGWPQVSDLLRRIHECRNRFTHGQPGAIDDSLVRDLVAALEDEHKSWIAVFNKRMKQGPNLALPNPGVE